MDHNLDMNIPINNLIKLLHILSGRIIFYICFKLKEEKRNAYRTLVGKSKGKRLLGSPRRRWVDNLKMDLIETEWMVWIVLICLRVRTSEGLL
jgi:hypothetical protein